MNTPQKSDATLTRDNNDTSRDALRQERKTATPPPKTDGKQDKAKDQR